MDRSIRLTLIILLLVVMLIFGLVVGRQVLVIGNEEPSPAPELSEINAYVYEQGRELANFELVNEHGETVTRESLRGQWTFAFVGYTNCPDICSFITANVRKIYNADTYPEGTQFALITFDPERDRPGVLKSYAAAFEMDRAPFHFLTGPPDEIETLMNRVNIRKAVSSEQTTDSGESIYFLSHSDKILLIDSQSRLVFDYGGSMTPVDIVAEDLGKL